MTALPKRIQRQRTAGWRMPLEAVYVGRPTPWGNPFPVATGAGELFPRADSIRMYRELVTTGETWFGADGDLTNPHIAPVEALIDQSPATGAVNLSVRCELEPGDLEKLAAGGTVWLTFWGVIVPFALTVVEPQT
jgi:hypothetical protein